jgi:hypothetical protein
MEDGPSLGQWAGLCHQRMVESQFTGDITLSRPDLIHWAAMYPEIQRKLKEPERSAALTALAVSCAYHFYDQEGFWKHFCSLLGIELGQQGTLGSRIEAYLLRTGRLTKTRTGPFRYVGAVLEQCGVSQLHIGSFARLLFDLSRRLGWASLAAIELPEFQRLLSAYGYSHYLLDYLRDTEGWRFSTHVAHLMELHASGLMSPSDLGAQQGFQPSFWPQFLEVGKSERPGPQATLPRPYLLFDPRNRGFAMRFPKPGYLTGALRGWSFPLTWLRDESDWRTSYSGTFCDDQGHMHEWSIAGWVPDGRPVLFDARTGLIPKGDAVSAGSYFLMLSAGEKPGCQTYTEIGPAALPSCFPTYTAWAVTLAQHDVLMGYSVANVSTEVIELNWADDGYRFPWSGPGTEVFCGGLPAARASSMEAVSSGVIAVFAELDGKTFRLEGANLEREVCRLTDAGGVAAGRIWLVPLARSRRYSISRYAGLLHFVVFPDIKFEFEARLYGENESATISVDATYASALSLRGSLPERCGDRVVWRLDNRAEQVSGELRIGDVTADVLIQVSRAGLFDAKGRRVTLLETTDLGGIDPIWVRALPRSKVVLSLRSGTRAAAMLTVDARGWASAGASVPAELLKSLPSRGFDELCVTEEGTGVTVGTGACLFDAETLRAAVVEGVELSDLPDCSMSRVATTLSTIASGPLNTITIDRMPAVHPAIDDWIRLMLACAIVYDNTVVHVGDRLLDPTDLMLPKPLLEYLSTVEQGRGRLGDPLGDWIPSVPRWRPDQFPPPPSEADTYCNWREALLRSPFAGLPDTWSGDWHVLTGAWINYLQGDHLVAVGRLDGLSSSDQLVSALSLVLRFHIYLRQARFAHAARILQAGPTSSTTAGWSQTVRPLFTGAHVIRVEDQHPLPLAPVDRRMLLLLQDVCRPGFDPAGEDDWLVLWAGYRLSRGSSKTGCARQLLQSLDRLPPSPELHDLQAELSTIGGDQA